MNNFLEETRAVIKKEGKSENDINWVGNKSGDYAISWEDFEIISNFEYDDDYGAQEIVFDLVIVFKDDTWLERYEYDGDGWWVYKSVPQRQTGSKSFNNLKGVCTTIREIN